MLQIHLHIALVYTWIDTRVKKAGKSLIATLLDFDNR